MVDIGVKLEPWLRRYSRKTIKNVFSIQIGAEKSGNHGKELTRNPSVLKKFITVFSTKIITVNLGETMYG